MAPQNDNKKALVSLLEWQRRTKETTSSERLHSSLHQWSTAHGKKKKNALTGKLRTARTRRTIVLYDCFVQGL